MEIVLIWWRRDDLREIKVYAERDNTEIKFPYNHRVAKSYVDMLKILLKEYPEDIEINPDLSEYNLPEEFKKEENDYLLFIDAEKEKRYISSLQVKKLQKIFPEIERKVTKGVRLDVH